MVGLVEPESPKDERSQGREVQGGLFSGFEEVRLPRRREAADHLRNDRSAPEPHARPDYRRSRPGPSLPLFDRPKPPARAPTAEPRPDAAQAPLDPAPVWSEPLQVPAHSPEVAATGEVAKARGLLQAIRVLKRVEADRRPPTADERRALAGFCGFGLLALRIFPDPSTGRYKGPTWQALGEELSALLSPEEYASARRTVFNAFYTSPEVVASMFQALKRLGVPEDATVLEPGCGSGNFLRLALEGMHFIGVELDSLSGRVARALFPRHDIRIESFRDTKLPERSIDAVIGNPPFADVKHEHDGVRLSLHDFFLAKSLDALGPGGILALVTTHYTLDKQNASVREYLGTRADFLGAIRLPSDAFAREGTKVVTDIVFLKRRDDSEPAGHVDARWLEVSPLAIEGVQVPINRYFHDHPEMVLGTWSRKDRLYGGEQGFSVVSTGPLEDALRAAVGRLPELETRTTRTRPEREAPPFTPPPLERHVTEGSFF